jgi:xylulose-5-phosphate/fructose-6-phosphate phosphoketolase
VATAERTAASATSVGLDQLDVWWRAANYLSVGQLYLRDNPLLTRPLQPGDIKPRLLGHWGTTPGLTFMWAHCNRVIVGDDAEMIFVCGPGHGGPAMVAAGWLEGSYEERYPDVGWSVDGMRRLFARFSAPGGVPSHAAPETPGSLHEGGELGYSLSHAQGAAFDDPDLIVACAIGDGEAETGPLAGSWTGGRFLDPVTDGTVLPILHLNGFKIANPTVLAAIPDGDLHSLLSGHGYEPLLVSGHEPTAMHEAMADAMDRAVERIRTIREDARSNGRPSGAVRWPMIVLRSPKGWTGPAEVDGEPVEGHFNSHQIPLAVEPDDDDARHRLEAWMRGYRPAELFEDDGRPVQALIDAAPRGDRRMSADPRTNGGLVATDLELPALCHHALTVDAPATDKAGSTRFAGRYLRDVIAANPRTFRLFGPDEVASNRLDDVFDATDRRWLLDGADLADGHLAPEGRVMEVLSEQLCEGWLEGYLLTGRHGLFTSYEAFIHIVDSMFNQHAKWIEASAAVEWRAPLPSLTYLLSSHVWRQDHNGFTHQDPGFLDVVANKKADVARLYLPPDANCLLSVLDHCLRSRDHVNVIVAGKQQEPQYLDLDSAVEHCTTGVGMWPWAGNEDNDDPVRTITRPTPGGEAPDVVLACAGDVPTMETIAAARLLQHDTDLVVRVVNVVDLMALQSPRHHPHGLEGDHFDALFTADRPVVFAFHGYPQLIHRLTYDRTNHHNLHVRGYEEAGTTTTPFDMVVLNHLDRFHLAMEAIDRVDATDRRLAEVRQRYVDRLEEHARYIREHGVDLPDLDDWRAGVDDIRP